MKPHEVTNWLLRYNGPHRITSQDNLIDYGLAEPDSPEWQEWRNRLNEPIKRRYRSNQTKAIQSNFYNPLNPRDPFSHSEQCEQLSSTTHKNCQCWCHNALDYLTDPSVDYALPEEYITSADRAFLLDEPGHVRVGFSSRADEAAEVELTPASYDDDSNIPGLPEAVTIGERSLFISAIDIHEGPTNKAGFSHWSRKELLSGKCDNCGDPLVDCECVE